MEQLITACEWAKAPYLVFSDNVFASYIYYSHFFAIAVSLVIGLFIYLRGKKELVNNLLFCISIFLSIWVFSDLVLWASEKPQLIMFFWTLEILFEPLIYAFSLYFFLVFVDKKDITISKKVGIFALLAPIILFASTKFALLGFDLTNCDRVAIEGPLPQYGYIIELLFVVWIVIAAVGRLRKAASKELKTQIVLMALALGVFLFSFSFGNIVEVFTDNWGVGQIGLAGVGVFVAVLGYLIVKFKTFNIKLIATQALVWALALMVAATFFVKTLGNMRAVLAATLILVILIGYLLIRSVKREVSQRERLQQLAQQLEQSNLSLAEANDKLKGLDKLKTEFLSLASHQLRSPLTAIKGYSSMLIEGSYGTLDDKSMEGAKRIYTSAQGLANIVEDLLNVSKIEQGGMKYEFMETDLAPIVTTLYNEMQIPAQSKDIAFRLSMDVNEKFMVNADPTKIKQVFLNLTDNSIKYTPDHGVITVSLVRDGKHIVFAVTDNGMGISEETRVKLFEKFSRGEGGKTNTGGSGLGLYLAKQIAIAHKGDVVIESEGLGKGATFKVILPAI